MLFGSSPIYNAILFYILFIIIILVMKPNIMYNHQTKKFKPFGCGGPDQTFFAFPIVALSSAVIFYIIFLVGSILNNYLDSTK